MITCDKATKTSNSLICFNSMFHMFHDLVVILYLSYYYPVAMFQGMRNSCCTTTIHKQSSMKQTEFTNVASVCFSDNGMMR